MAELAMAPASIRPRIGARFTQFLTMRDQDEVQQSLTPRTILGISLWFGLAVGLVELAIALAVKPLIDPSPGLFRMNRVIFWTIPSVDFTLFALCGAILATIAWLRPQLKGRVALGVLGGIAVLILLLAARRIHPIACVALACGVGFRLGIRTERNIQAFTRICRRSAPFVGLASIGIAAVSFGSHVLHEPLAAAQLPPAPSTPNVLLVVLDTVRADRMSLYGYPRDTTPNLVKRAATGVTFTQARSTAPWTLPSHASMLTGRWPHEHQAGMDRGLDAKHATLAEYLGSQGYATAGFVANELYCGAETGLARGFGRYEDKDFSLVGALWTTALGRRVLCPIFLPQEERAGDDPLDYYRKEAARVTSDTLRWIDRQGERPFFAFLNLYDAHNPYIPPDGFKHRFGRPSLTSQDDQIIDRWFVIDKSTLKQDEVQFVADAYDDCIAYLDEQLEVLFKELETRGKLDNTLVIVTADHGEHFGEHALYGHASSLYDQEIRVPLLMIAPGQKGAGKAISSPVSLRDLAATVCELATPGTKSPLPGKSLARHWTGDGSIDDEPVLSEVDAPAHAAPNQGRSPVFRGPMKAVIRGPKVYVKNGDGREELFDISVDPAQSRDLSEVEDSEPFLDRAREDLDQLLR